MNIKWCPKCHKEAYRTINENGVLKIIQGGNTLFPFSEKSKINISIACPSGHPVMLKIGEQEENNGSHR